MLQGARCRGHHLPARPDLAGEGDLGDAWMSDQRSPGLRRALDEVEDPGGKARIPQTLGEAVGAQRGQLGGLEDHRVAASERRRGLPAGDLEGVVPRADASADAEGLPPGVDEGARQRRVLPVQLVRQAGEVLQAVRARVHVDRQGLCDGLAGVEDLYVSQLLVALSQQPRGPRQDPAALSSGDRRPGLEARLCRDHRPLHVRRAGLVDPCESFASGGGVGEEAAPRGRGDLGSVDEELPRLHRPRYRARER